MTYAGEICLQMVVDKAYGAATCPKDVPNNVSEALRSPQSEQWQEAMNAKMDAHISNSTWELIKLPEGCKVIGSHWVLIVKCNADGSIDKYKAHLIAQGFTQMSSVDYNQTFSLATHLATLHIILIKSTLNGEHIETIDISNAYLNGKVKSQYKVYMCSQ